MVEKLPRERLTSSFRMAILCICLCFLSACVSEVQKLQPEQARFSVIVPCRYSCHSIGPDIDNLVEKGVECRCTVFFKTFALVFVPSLDMSVTWADLLPGADADEVLEGIRKSFLETGETDTLVSLRATSLGGKSAVEFEVRSKRRFERAEFELSVRRRYAIWNGKLYCLGVVGVMSPVGERAWRDFVNSFRFES